MSAFVPGQVEFLGLDLPLRVVLLQSLNLLVASSGDSASVRLGELPRLSFELTNPLRNLVRSRTISSVIPQLVVLFLKAFHSCSHCIPFSLCVNHRCLELLTFPLANLDIASNSKSPRGSSLSTYVPMTVRFGSFCWIVDDFGRDCVLEINFVLMCGLSDSIS
jgi:hypothetical protein